MSSYLEYLNSLETFGIKLGLENTVKLHQLSGSQADKLEIIHIAGTNGKGSTGAMLQAALRNCGFKVGFYSSPHLKDFRERIRIDGEAISESELKQEFESLKVHAEKMKLEGNLVTYFEFTTILAINYFAKKKVDFVVLETGMGGRFDSTNIVNSRCAVITNISLDHQKYLGETIEKIAFEKAGIIKENGKIFAGVMDDVAFEVIQNEATKKHATVVRARAINDLEFKYNNYTQQFKIENYSIELDLIGSMQRKNALLVFEVLRYLAQTFNFDFAKALSGLKRTTWPGRCQKINDHLIVDGGHNIDGIKSLIQALEEAYPNYKYNVVFSSFKDKDTEQCLRLLETITTKFYFKRLNYQYRASYNEEELTALLRTFSNKDFERLSNWEKIILASKNAKENREIYVICGSLYLVGEFLEYINYDLNKI